LLPRLPLAHAPTPVEPLDRLGAHLGLRPGQLLLKRDDLTGVAGGGNKARKLEFLCADALARGCDVFVTGGGTQSNHARASAAAARRVGLECVLALAGTAPERPEGNVLLETLLGARIVWLGKVSLAELEQAIPELAGKLAAEGRRPYPVPLGGSTPIGAQGYVVAADEIAGQVPADALIVHSTGTGGTQAGLLAGLGDASRVIGISSGAVREPARVVAELALQTAALAGRPAPRGEPIVHEEWVGPAYAALTDACREAMELAARLEGVVLDPVYTGKAMAGLIGLLRSGRIGADRSLLFLHTGGLPGLFTARHAEWLAASAAVASP
jgi:D-cysteine desulfhydrase